MQMKTVQCDGPGCEKRRKHHDEPYEPRGVQSFEAPIDHDGPFFCSLECQSYWYGAVRRELTDRIEALQKSIANRLEFWGERKRYDAMLATNAQWQADIRSLKFYRTLQAMIGDK